MSVIVKLFMEGEDQVLELPDEFRFAGEKVRISKVGDKVILEPLETPRSADIGAVAEKPDSPDEPS
jgi:antitoxin VapB